MKDALDILEQINIVGVWAIGILIFLYALYLWVGILCELHANKIMEANRHNNQQSIEWLKSDLNIFKEKYLKGFNDKIDIYRQMIGVISGILSDFNTALITGKRISIEQLNTFDKERMRIYGYLAMFASQDVMDAQDKLIDHLFQVADGEPYVWLTVRELIFTLFNEVRKDIGIDISPRRILG